MSEGGFGVGFQPLTVALPPCAQCGRVFASLSGSELWNCGVRVVDDGTPNPPIEFVCSRECSHAVATREALEAERFDVEGVELCININGEKREVKFHAPATAEEIAAQIQKQVQGVHATVTADGIALGADGHAASGLLEPKKLAGK